MSGAFQPFSTTDDQGRLVGFDADIATELARRLDRPAELVQVDWAGIQAALQLGKVDLICGSMAITDERQETMQFSLPYYVSGAQVFARRGTASLDGARLGVTEDSTYATYVHEHPADFPGVEILRYGSEAEIIAALGTDKVDAFVSDRIVGGFYIHKAGTDDIEAQGDLLYREACGIAARKSDTALVEAVNRALLDMIQDGTYAQIYRRWVGSPPALDVLLSSWSDHVGLLPQARPAADAAPEKAAPQFADRVGQMLPLLVEGAGWTLLLSLLTALLSLVTGTFIGLLSISRRAALARLAQLYVWLVRGTPLLVQLFIAYFAVATFFNRLFGAEVMGPFGAALFALVANTTAYNAETVRGGILAVDDGQWDAAAALGMSRGLTLRRIILPQALRAALPSFGNNLVVLVKDTSLVGAITLIELSYAARNVVFQTGQALLPFLLAAAFYVVIIGTLSLAVSRLERRTDGDSP